MFLSILIFLLLVIAVMVVSFVLHRRRPLMPVLETSTMELDLNEFPTHFEPPFHFPGDVDLRSFPYQLFRIFSSPPEQCIICLGRFQPHHQLISLPLCGHVFHSYCIRSWLHNNQNCPLCRRGIVVVNNDDDISTTSSDAYFTNSTAATDGSFSSSEEDDLNASSSSSVLPRDSFQEYTFLNGTLATDDSFGSDPLPVAEEELDDDHMAVASSETPPPQDSFQIFDDEIVEESTMVAEEGVLGQPEPDQVEKGCFSRWFTFICPKKVGAQRESGSGESHVVGESPVLAGCFSRCSKVIKGGLMKFRARRKAGGGSGQADRV